MKGAITEPCAATSNAPRITITRIIGASQSFLRTRRKTHSSLIKSIWSLELIVERVAGGSRGDPIDPLADGASLVQTQHVAFENPRKKCYWGD